MMNALTLADIDISQDLDRDALATIGGAGWGHTSAYGLLVRRFERLLQREWMANSTSTTAPATTCTGALE